MKKLTAEEIQKNYEAFVKCCSLTLSPERYEKVKVMLDDLEDIMALAPASGKNWYHGAYAGGYIVHVLKVVKAAYKVRDLFKSMGGNIDFTDEELIFSALFHDLGKVGDVGKPNYLVQDSEWHRVNQGSEFKNNTDLDFMLVPDRSLYLLQKYGITVSQKEYLAIMLHDGMYEETNKPYLFSFNPGAKLKTNIVTVLHIADHLAASSEFDQEHCEYHEY